VSTIEKPEDYLVATAIIDSDHPDVVALARAVAGPAADQVAAAVALYYRVRDGLRYNPYHIATTPEGYRASTVLASGEGWCVSKALVLAALCRAVGIPARLGYADVRNHLSTARLRETMQTDVFYFHGYTSLFLDNRWVKATPAFNIELCEKFGLRPLEFNGRQDSLYHEFDMAGNRHMEYLHDRGEYADLPFTELMTVMQTHYPAIMATWQNASPGALSGADWDADVELEVATPPPN